MPHDPKQDATKPPPRDPRLEIPEILREPAAGTGKPSPKPDSIGNTMGEMGFALAIGIDFLVVAAAGGGAGWFIDRQFGWSPWGLLIGISIGFGGGLFRLIKRLEKQERDEKRAKAAREASQTQPAPAKTPNDTPRAAPKD